MKKLLLFILLTCSAFAFGINISNSSIANGKTVLLELDKEKDLEFKSVKVGKKTYKIFQNPLDKNRYYALIAFSYYENPKREKLEISYIKNGKNESKILFLDIVDGKYKKEQIKVQNSKVKLSKKDKKRASKEYAEAMKVYNTINKKSYIKKEFIVPLDSKITSDFGKARVYNDTLKGYHSGTDFRAKIGTPIIAANDGIIALAKDRFYSGGSIVIDHGQGVYTCYFHMSEFKVKKGDFVKRGDIIGLSGDTGRVTGPHLHFCARVAGVQVDPLQLIEIINKNLIKGQ
jgi:murein DD-endopeptidase MepM/ murein hydrolase activator NlpD